MADRVAAEGPLYGRMGVSGFAADFAAYLAIQLMGPLSVLYSLT